MRVGAVLAWAAGLTFGLPCVYAIWYFAGHGQVWTFVGFRTPGHGPFEDIGIETSTAPAGGLSRDSVRRRWLSASCSGGNVARGLVALALLPIELVFWIGFALPFAPLFDPPAGAVVLAVVQARA